MPKKPIKNIVAPTKYEIKLLPLVELKVYNNPNVKNNYQRPLNEKHAEHIAENMQEEALSVLNVVQREDKSYALLDGQHNKAALQKNGYTHAHCKVWKASGSKASQWIHEARVFIHLNDKDWRKQLGDVDIHNALVARGEPRACHISKVLQGHGIKVRAKRNDWGYVSRTKELERAYDRGTFDETIDVLNRAFAQQTNVFSGYLLASTSAWIKMSKQAGHWNTQVRDLLVCALRGIKNPNAGNCKIASERTKMMKACQDKFSGEARAVYTANEFLNKWYQDVAPKSMWLKKPRATKKKVVKKKVVKKTTTKK